MKLHMRLVASQVDQKPLLAPVAIDIVLRGHEPVDIERIQAILECFLDVDADISGEWAGIGRGEFVEKEITLA